MIQNYLRTAYRNLKKYRYFSLSNILGLSIALLAFFYINRMVAFENSFDNHVPQKERIYRVSFDEFRNGELNVRGCESFVGCGPAFAQDIAEIESYTRTYNVSKRLTTVISYYDESGENHSDISEYYFADSTFLDFFGIEVTKGNKENALHAPLSAVITEEVANQFFGEEDPVGKTLIYNDENFVREEYEITAVIKETPSNTHLPFKILLSYSSLASRDYPAQYTTSWNQRRAYTYVKVYEDANIIELEKRMKEIASKYKEPKEGEVENYILEPLEELHFIVERDEAPSKTSNKASLNMLELISYFVLLIALINFINLSTANLMGRSTMVGINKVLGAGPEHLVIQNYVETFLIIGTSTLLAYGSLYLFYGPLATFSGTEVPQSWFLTFPFILFIALSVVISGVIAGAVPALVVLGMDPVKALTGKLNTGKGKSYRQGLSTLQFSLSFIMIAAALIVFSQIHFMQRQSLGLDISNTLIIKPPGAMPSDDYHEVANAYQRFLNTASSLPFINKQASSLSLPGDNNFYRTSVRSKYKRDGTTIRFNGVGPEFIEAFDMDLIAGRNFRFNNKYDIDSTVVISKMAAADLGFKSPEDALGNIVRIDAFGMRCEIIGVVNDYRLESIKSELEPMAFMYYEPIYTSFFALKFDSQEALNLASIEAIWKEVFPGNPFIYFELEDYYNRYFEDEKSQLSLIVIFSIMAVILAVMGMIGLSMFTLSKKTKEIGIRKALGSSVGTIFNLMTFRFIRLILLSIILGVPVIWYFAHHWLMTFPTRITLSWFHFILPAGTLIVIGFLSVAIQTFRAATVNPIKVLRND